MHNVILSLETFRTIRSEWRVFDIVFVLLGANNLSGSKWKYIKYEGNTNSTKEIIRESESAFKKYHKRI